MQQTRNKFRWIAAFTAILVALPLLAWAKPEVIINIKAEKEVVVTENGKEVRKIVEAKEITPGETVTYKISYENKGDEAATNVVIKDPIPEGTSFIPGTASETGDLTFSIDQGKSYKKPALLTYEVTTPDGGKEKQVASPEKYSHIRWTLPSVGPGEKGVVSFKVRVN